MRLIFSFLAIFHSFQFFCQDILLTKKEVPSIYSDYRFDSIGKMQLKNKNGKYLTIKKAHIRYTLDQLRNNLSANDKGLTVTMPSDFSGKVYFGLITPDAKTKQPVFFKKTAPFENGKAFIDVTQLSGRYDISDWELNGKVSLGYRIADSKGNILYDGKIRLEGKGPFKIDTSMIEGPFVNNITENSVVLSYKTNFPIETKVFVGNIERRNSIKTTSHEISVSGLNADSLYDYTIYLGKDQEKFHLKTAPAAGSRKPFVFAYASDCRNGEGGGERNIFGVNAFMIKKMAALGSYEKMAFFQFTGDLITGYSQSPEETRLQYANWKRAVEPFAGSIPFYTGIGNHEGIHLYFEDENKKEISIPAFPFQSHGSESVFSSEFVNPKNGPMSEDGSEGDPNPKKNDFPEYGETVYYYTYDNVGMIVLNSDYWYAQSLDQDSCGSGNLHGYIMDNQLSWLEKTLNKLQEDKNLDHIFVSIHTPAFPNAGHVDDDMWYNGNNHPRPYVSGKPVKKGIIERRDEFISLLLNHSKVVGYLAGDEHNYTRMLLNSSTPIYPENWSGKKIQVNRPLWCITNGAAGAPYYAFEKTPWSGSVERFTTQYTLLLFYVDGKNIKLRAVNPDTLEEIENVTLK